MKALSSLSVLQHCIGSANHFVLRGCHLVIAAGRKLDELRYYRKNEVEQLSMNIQKRIKDTPPGATITRTSEAAQNLGITPIPWGAVIAAIILGKVDIYRMPGKKITWRTGTGITDLRAFVIAVE